MLRPYRIRFLGALIALTLTLSCDAGAETYPYRFVFVSNFLRSDGDVEQLRTMMQRSADAGYSGIVLRSNLDRIGYQDEVFLQRLEAVRQMRDDIGIEVVPLVFSSGHGNVLLHNDRNLAAAVPVQDQRYVARDGVLELAPDFTVSIENPGFEQREADRAPGVRFQDRPGESTIVDNTVARTGRGSLRFENFDGAQRRFARAMYDVAVQPRRTYRFRLWVKTDGIQARTFQLQVRAAGGERVLNTFVPNVAATADWQQVEVGFNTLDHDHVLLYAGVWAGDSGRFWIDDVSVVEEGPINILRRDGAPVTVRGADGREYVEGKDYARVIDKKLNYGFDHVAPAIEVPAGSAIVDGAEVFVSYYQGVGIRHSQMAVCFSEQRVYELQAEVVDLLEKHLRPKHYFISADEIRQGGWCQACEERGIPTGQIIGEGVRSQVGIIRERNPDAEVFVWGDMFDPSSNAHDNFFLTKGDLAGSWESLPLDAIMVVWVPNNKEASLRHFEQNGFRTMASTFGDRGGIDELLQWTGELAKCDKACGLMYTTWRDNYSNVESFGEHINADNP